MEKILQHNNPSQHNNKLQAFVQAIAPPLIETAYDLTVGDSPTPSTLSSMLQTQLRQNGFTMLLPTGFTRHATYFFVRRTSQAGSEKYQIVLINLGAGLNEVFPDGRETPILESSGADMETVLTSAVNLYQLKRHGELTNAKAMYAVMIGYMSFFRTVPGQLQFHSITNHYLPSMHEDSMHSGV